MGWTDARLVRHGMRLHQTGRLSVLTTSNVNSNVRGALSDLQKAFSADVDFVPLCPTQDVTLDDAMRLGRQYEDDLLDQLDTLRGNAQFSLIHVMDQTRYSDIKSGSGRQWLRNRMQAHNESLETHRLLQQIAAPYPVHLTNADTPRGATRCDVLIPKSEAASFRTTTTRKASCAFASGKLTISGPWVPLSFVQPINRAAENV